MMHFSIEFSKAKLRVINGLYVIDLLLHFPQVTIVFCIPIKVMTIKYLTTE